MLTITYTLTHEKLERNTMTQKQEKIYYQEHIKRVCEVLGISKEQYTLFKLCGILLQKAFCLSCNGYRGKEAVYKGNKMINRYTEAMYKKDTNPIYKKAQALAKELKLEIFFQTDPRGATIYVSKDPIPENNYTIASCIY